MRCVDTRRTVSPVHVGGSRGGVRPDVVVAFQLRSAYRVRPLSEGDVNEEYVSWLNDAETAAYLAPRSVPVTIETQRHYVRRVLASPFDALFGLFDANGRLLGTSGVQRIGAERDGPWVGVLIGPNAARGRGLGTALIWIVAATLFGRLGARRMYAGMLRSNLASLRAFVKIGCRVDAELTEALGARSEYETTEGIVVSCTASDLVAPDVVGISCVAWLDA